MAMTFGEQKSGGARFVGIGFVVLLHIVLVYALVTGLGRNVIEVIRAPIETKIIEEVKPPPPDLPPPPPPPPQVAAPPPPFIPPPEIQIQAPPPAPTAITAVTTVKPPEAPPPVARPAPVEPVRVGAGIDPSRPCKIPDYPPVSERLRESGTVVVAFLIDVDGSVIQQRVETSSGHPRLDDAALNALARCKYRPATEDGKPVQSWATRPWVWKLPN